MRRTSSQPHFTAPPPTTSMGPHFFSAENLERTREQLNSALILQWGRTFLVRRTSTISVTFCVAKSLQWGRTFLVRRTFRLPLERISEYYFNGGRTFLVRRRWTAMLGCDATSGTSMGPHFFSAENAWFSICCQSGIEYFNGAALF